MVKRISKRNTPIDKIRDKTLEIIMYPYNKLSGDQRFWLGFVFISIVTSLLISNPFLHLTTAEYKEGDIARQDIRSPADIIVEDEKETTQNKKLAGESIHPIFHYQSGVSDQAVQRFRSAWEKLGRSVPNKNANVESKPDTKWSGSGGEKLGKTFTSRRFSNNELDSITRVLRESSFMFLCGNKVIIGKFSLLLYRHCVVS